MEYTEIIIWVILGVLVRYLLLSLVKQNQQQKEGFYEFVEPSSLNIPAMFALSDGFMANIFGADTHIMTPKEGICK